MRIGRLVLGLVLGTVVAVSASLWAAQPAEALSCIGPLNGRAHFAENKETHTSATFGSSARMEYVDEHLCTTSGADTFSSSWISVVGDDVDDLNGFNIYQVGIDKCLGDLCGPTSPVNQPYAFFAYGRMEGPCTLKLPSPEKKTVSISGTRTYSVFIQLAPNGHDYDYHARISGVDVDIRPSTDLSYCWNGVDAAEIANEVWDRNDQSGGPNSNRQNFESPQWRDSSTWRSITRSPGFDCDLIEIPLTQKCVWASDGSNVWWSWDTRY